MAKKLQLTIPTPCHEDWEKMTSDEKGKFCSSCQKQVIDFSNMNDRQLAAFFKKPSAGSVCGRFMSDQLERDIEIPAKRIPWAKYFLQVAIPAFLFSLKATGQRKTNEVKLSTCNKVIGDTIVVSNTIAQQKTSDDIKKQEVQRLIKGIVLNNGSPIPGAIVKNKNQGNGIQTSNSGTFSLLAATGNILIITGAGLEPKEFIVDNTDSVAISVNHMRVGEVDVTKRGRKNKIMKLLEKPVDTAVAALRCYPNPVSSGSTITIDCKKIPEENYTITLVNLSGQSVNQQELWIDSKIKRLRVNLPSVITGNYLLVMTNKKTGKKFTEKIIIQ